MDPEDREFREFEQALVIIREFSASDLDSLNLVQGNFKIALSRRGDVDLAQSLATVPSSGNLEPPPPAVDPREEVPSASPVTPGAPVSTTSAASAESSTQVVVRAPAIGTVYLSPDPDSSPFVTPGTVVDETDTVALVETMKLFTSVAAGYRGVVRAVYVENGSFVEYGQELLAIEVNMENG
ncbi:MAG: acetyl-CoA carboxylase biotin carboxyl carrier protein [Acidimicrobiales bacterium]